MKRTTLALVAAGFMAAGPAFAQGTAGGTTNTGPQGTGNFVAGKPEGTGNPVAGKPGDPPAANKAGANTSGAGAGAGATSAGDMGGTNASKK
ncbi:MAG: hypothetical protein QOF41_146 [Methylobacteriaceae bacterium]|jgi:hypothetical protein|nr:hypothetical protein [Methylobacteriaceae bacterium]